MSEAKNGGDSAALVHGIVTRDFANDHHAFPFDLHLDKGMGWCLYSDDGPSGICGQSVDITCPHAYLAVWPNENAMREAMESSKVGRRGKRERIMWGVIGEWTTGKFTVSVHG